MRLFRTKVSRFFAVAALAVPLAGCQSGEPDATKMSGPPSGAMDKAGPGKMDGAMDKMDSGKMEGGAGKMDAPKGEMDKMEGAPK